jgi:hypothetical protein
MLTARAGEGGELANSGGSEPLFSAKASGAGRGTCSAGADVGLCVVPG